MSIKRPKRVWIICGVNIFTAGVSLVVFMFLRSITNTPLELRPSIGVMTVGGLLAPFLIVSSLLLFFRVRYSQWLVLIAAVFFYGALVLQQAVLLEQIGDTLTERQRLKILASSTRSIIEILLNAWALFSPKTSQYFAANGEDPHALVQADDPAPGGATV
jgi:hypothetical protein